MSLGNWIARIIYHDDITVLLEKMILCAIVVPCVGYESFMITTLIQILDMYDVTTKLFRKKPCHIVKKYGSSNWKV